MLCPSVDKTTNSLPGKLSKNDKSRFVVVKGRYLAEYVYRKNPQKIKYHKVGSVRSSSSIPSTCTLYYFEMKVIDEGDKGLMEIGLTNKFSKLNRMPGWGTNSIGYHGDNGKIYNGRKIGSEYGPSFGVGDIVGCGLDLKRNIVFFTKNGRSFGVAVYNLPNDIAWYPTTCLNSRNEKVEINFGQKRFAFNVPSYLGKRCIDC